MKLFETMLPSMYSKSLFEEKNTDLASEHTDKMADILFTGTAYVLKSAKSKEKPAAYVFNKIDGTVIAAAIVQFFENSDKDNPGNWSLVWTFDAADIPDGALRITLDDLKSHQYFRSVAGEKYGIRFESPSAMVDCLTVLIAQIKKCLDENAKAGSEFSIEQDGIFQARSTVENGEKVFALEVDGEIKNLIKDDAAIEK